MARGPDSLVCCWHRNWLGPVQLLSGVLALPDPSPAQQRADTKNPHPQLQIPAVPIANMLKLGLQEVQDVYVVSHSLEYLQL